MKKAICLLSTLPSIGKWNNTELLWCRKLPIFAFSQRWGFNYFVCILQQRVVIALFRRLHRSRRGNLHFCGLWLWRYASVQFLLSVVFLALYMIRKNVFLTLNFKASIIYRFFSLSVTHGIFALWFSLNQMFVIKFSVSFDTVQVERTTPSPVIIVVFTRQKTYREQLDTFLLQRTTFVA